MKLSVVFVFIMAVLASLVAHSEAAPKVPVGAIKKGGKVIVSTCVFFNLYTTNRFKILIFYSSYY